MNNIKVSLICTLKNEECSITEFLDSLFNQSRLPNEIIIVDGGSTDRTVDIINSYVENGAPIKLIIRNGVNIAQGRNIAIENAKYEIIASTDAGCRIDHQWLENLIKPFTENQSIDVVSGWYKANANNLFEKCVKGLMYPIEDKVNSETFLPSSRSIAFKKSAWKSVGGYPEWLYTAEDTLFDLNLKKKGFTFKIAFDAVVYWKPRNSVLKFIKQIYLYSKGNGKASLHSKKYATIYAIYSVGFLWLLYGINHPIFVIPLIFLFCIYIGIYFIKIYEGENEFKILYLLPLILLVFDLSKIIGYFVGLCEKIKMISFKR